MGSVTRKEVSIAISRLMPQIIQGVHLDFMDKGRITQTQFLILVAIHSRNTTSMRILADSMHVSMPTMSGIINRLVKANLVKRTVGSDDRRQVMLTLSPSGAVLIQQFQ